MERSVEREQSSNSSDMNQGGAGEVTRRMAEAQLGEGLREPSSPRSPEKRFIPKDIHDSEFSLEENSVIPLDLHKPIFKRVLTEKFLDIYDNEQDRCAAIEFLEKSGDISVARKFVKQLTDERLNDDPETQLRMISAIGKLGDQSVVPELLDMLSSLRSNENRYYKDAALYGAIAGVTVMLDRQSAVPELLDMLSDQQQNDKKRLMIAYAIGMSGHQSATAKLRSIHSSLDISSDLGIAIYSAIRILESPSVESGLAKVMSMDPGLGMLTQNQMRYFALPLISGKLGDISVAKRLVKMFSDNPKPYLVDQTPRAVEEIVGRKLGNPEEIRELAEQLLNESDKRPRYLTEMPKDIIKAVSGLGKRLVEIAVQETTTSKGEGGVKLEDVKQLSKKIVAKLFSEPIFKMDCASSIANAVFELEQHLAEPDPLKRILDPREVMRKACKNIKDEILQHRQNFIENGEVTSKFYEILSKVTFSNDTRLEMRIWVFRPIMKEAGPSFAPRLEKLSTPQGRSGTRGGLFPFNEKGWFINEKGWFITKEVQQRMRKFAQDLRNPSSSNAENPPPIAPSSQTIS